MLDCVCLCHFWFVFFFFKQKTAYEMRISDWSSDVCSSDLSYRNRTAVLGDIVDSQPVYVGAPDSNLFYGKTFTGSSAYATFANGKTFRTPIIWVAANDGMQIGRAHV